MTNKDITAIEQELDQLRAKVAQLEAEAAAASSPNDDWTRRYYLTYYATTGFFLGMIAALTSLMFNVVGSLLVGQHPLQLIKVYLTFGLGERALNTELDSGLVLALGCCLYIATGMVLGALFEVVLSRWQEKGGFGKRLLVASGLGIAVWVVNYYLLLSWLQPLLFGGDWILTEIPWWVALLTHLVFAWTMALIYPLGIYEPYRVRTE